MPSRRSSKKDSPAKRLEGALDELRAAVFEAYAAIAEEGAKTGTEQQRRESALQFIDEILEGRPLATFSATNSRIARNTVRLLARGRGGRRRSSCELSVGCPSGSDRGS